MRGGTRRMWSRRVLRAGWALAPVLQFPGNAWHWVRKHEALIFACSILGAFISAMIFMLVTSAHRTDPASAEEIREAANENECVKANLPDLAERNTVIHVYDLQRLEAQCADAAILAKQKQEVAKIK